MPNRSLVRASFPSTALLLAPWLALAIPAAADEIYRWTDAQGNVHFSSTPTSDATSEQTWDAKKSQRVRIVPGANGPANAAGTSSRPSPAAKPAPTFTPGQEPKARGFIQGRTRGSWRSESRRYEQSVANLERSIESTDDRLTSPPSFRSWRSLARWEARMERRLESQQAQLEQAEDALTEFETRAHRAGVPQSWLQD